jgi:molybdopterin molybdotransferase
MNDRIDGADLESGVLTVDAALIRILDSVTPVEGSEEIDIRHAMSRVIARPVVSPINVPPHTNSAMDGFALRHSDLEPSADAAFNLAGSVYAGQTFEGRVGSGECVRIMTGAPIPAGADTVIRQEDAEVVEGIVRIGTGHKPGQNVRQAGEDLARGSEALRAGKRVGPAEIGLLASLGLTTVEVKRKVKVVVFSTGDELRSIGEPLGESAIYDSNRYSLQAMLERLGVEIVDMGIVPDRRDDIQATIQEAACESDMVITSGGVSVGEADYVREILEELGGINFWKVAMKPGKPLAFGSVGEASFFGLPGNPVAVMVTFYQFVQPALRVMMGEERAPSARFKVPCHTQMRKRPGRTEFQRGVLYREQDGTMAVRLAGKQGSGILSSMSQANCFIILGVEQGDVEPGDIVEVEPFYGVV